VVLKRTGILTARNSLQADSLCRLSAFSRASVVKMRAFADGDYIAAFARRFHLPAGDQAKFAQPAFYNAECVLVDQANLAQPKLVLWELESAGSPGMRESSPMYAEAGGSVELAEQPEGDLVQTPHAPSDALVVVDRIGSGRASVSWQLVRHQASGPPAVEQLAQAKIKAQCFLRSFEAGLVFTKHGLPYPRM
jgi:hypothetical protein